MPLDPLVAETGSHLLDPYPDVVAAGANVPIRDLAAGGLIRSVQLAGVISPKNPRFDLLHHSVQNIRHFSGNLRSRAARSSTQRRALASGSSTGRRATTRAWPK